MVSKGGALLTKPRPIGVGLEIANFAGTGLTKALIKGILRGPVKFLVLIHLLNYTVI